MITIISWFSPKLLDNTGYCHDQKIDDDTRIFSIAENLFNFKLNIMILKKDNNITICVSDGGFGQRG